MWGRCGGDVGSTCASRSLARSAREGVRAGWGSGLGAMMGVEVRLERAPARLQQLAGLMSTRSPESRGVCRIVAHTDL